MVQWLRRSRSQATLLLLLLVVSAASTALVAGLIGHHRDSESTSVTSAARAPAAESTLLLDPVRGGESALDAVVRRELRGSPLHIDRTLRTGPLEVRTATRTVRLRALAVDDLRSRGRLVDGSWPAARGDAVLQSDAAERAGIRTGDRIDVEGVGIHVVGTWGARNATDAVWGGDPSVASGRGPDGGGPLVMAEDDLRRVSTTPQAEVVVSPAPTLDADSLDAADTAVRGLVAAVDDLAPTPNLTGGLPDRLHQVEGERAAGRGLLAVAVALVAAVVVVSTRQLLQLLAEARRAGTDLLAARGTTTSALVVADAVEIGVVATAGAVIGGICARFIESSAPAVTTGLAVVAGTMLLTAVQTAMRTSRAPATRRPWRAAVVVLAAAALSAGQLLAYGSPVSRTDSGRVTVDPVAALAPALVLVALCLAGPFVLPPLLRSVARFAARAPGLVPVLPARRLARQFTTYGVVIMVLAIAAGFTIASAAVTGTWHRLSEEAAATANAADVRVALRLPDSASAAASPLDPYLALSDHARAALTTEGRVEGDAVEVVATSAALGSTLSALRPKPVGRPLPKHPLPLHLSLAGHPDGAVSASLWLAADDGRIVRREVADLPADELDGSVVTFRPPAGQWRVLGVEVAANGADDATRVSLSGLPGPTVTLRLDRATTRASVALGAVPKALPVLVTPAMRSLVGAGVGDQLSVVLPDVGFTVPAQVRAVEDTLPTVRGSRGVLADLPTLAAMSLAAQRDAPSPDEMWLATDRPADVAAKAVAVGVAPGTVTTSKPSDAVVRAALDVWRPAAFGVAAFALVALLAATVSLLEATRSQVEVLRALGLRPRRLGRLQGSELGVACVLGLVLGLLAGGIVALLTGGVLAEAAVPDRPDGLAASLRLDVSTAGWIAAALAAGCVLAVVLTVRRTLRQARRPHGGSVR